MYSALTTWGCFLARWSWSDHFYYCRASAESVGIRLCHRCLFVQVEMGMISFSRSPIWINCSCSTVPLRSYQALSFLSSASVISLYSSMVPILFLRILDRSQKYLWDMNFRTHSNCLFHRHLFAWNCYLPVQLPVFILYFEVMCFLG